MKFIKNNINESLTYVLNDCSVELYENESDLGIYSVKDDMVMDCIIFKYNEFDSDFDVSKIEDICKKYGDPKIEVNDGYGKITFNSINESIKSRNYKGVRIKESVI